MDVDECIHGSGKTNVHYNYSSWMLMDVFMEWEKTLHYNYT